MDRWERGGLVSFQYKIMSGQFKLTAALKRVVLAACFTSVILITTRIALQLGTIVNASTVAFCFLIVVLLSAFAADLAVAIATSIVATMCFNYFFLPPIGTFQIAAFDDWVALVVFLFTAIVLSRAMASARQNDIRSSILEKTAVQLKEFGLWLLSIPVKKITFSQIAEEATRVFKLQYCSIHLHRGEKWEHFHGTGNSELSKRVEENLRLSVERPYAVELIDEHSLDVRYTQIRKEMEPVLVLVVKNADFPVSGLNILACMIGLLVPEILQEQHHMHSSERI